MALQVSTPKRVFLIKGSGTGKNKKADVTLPDPHPDMTIPEVINHYKAQYPEIAAATLDGPKLEADRAVYNFKTSLGDKG